eukprot:GEMP01032499.1.p1 GENE.GEMP01032499.1~~GEMP01032499.1.p1  ORF type:complete len:574 (+),score=174.25 GEMP01032499.1:25-1746(+)
MTARETNTQVAVPSTENEVRQAYPCIRWMNGEEEVMPTRCATVADVRAEVCGLRETLWGDVVLMTTAYRVLLDDSEPIPEDTKFIAVIKPDASADTGASSDIGDNAGAATTPFNAPLWELCIRNHCLYGQANLVQKCVARVNAANIKARADPIMGNDNVYSMDPNLLFSNVWDNVVDNAPDKARIVLRILVPCGWDVNYQWNNRSNRLHTACRRGQTSIVQAIVEEGKDEVDIHRTYWDSMMQMEHTALSIAVYYNRHATAKYLVTRSTEHPFFDVNRCHQVRLFTNHQNALHLAADWGNPNMVHLLLTHGGDPTLADDNDDTPLHLCAKRGAADKNDESYRCIAGLLLDRKVNAHCRNTHGETPLDYGDDEGWLRTVMRARRAQSVDSRDTEQYTADTASNNDNQNHNECVEKDAGVLCAVEEEGQRRPVSDVEEGEGPVLDGDAGGMQPSGEATTDHAGETTQAHKETGTSKKARGATQVEDNACGAMKQVRQVSKVRTKDTPSSAKVKGTAKQAEAIKKVLRKEASISAKVKSTAKPAERKKQVRKKDTSSARVTAVRPKRTKVVKKKRQ